MSEQASTAILIFTRTAQEEAAVKTFAPKLGRKRNAAIAHTFIQHSHTVATATGLPVFTSSGPAQKGRTFGERLANAIGPVFEAGFEKIIIIGTDCPTLTSEVILRAGQKLKNGGLVLGPDKNGGVYLIGISKSNYSRQQFMALPWEKNTLQIGWEKYADRNSENIFWLKKQRDIDHALDFKKLFSELPSASQIRAQLNFILSVPHKNIWQNILIPSSNFNLKNIPLRAPPF